MKKINEAKYLGTMLNNKGDPGKELKTRISNTVVTWHKLYLFWKHSNCSDRFKLHPTARQSPLGLNANDKTFPKLPMELRIVSVFESNM